MVGKKGMKREKKDLSSKSGCELCGIDFARAVKDIEELEGEARASAILKLQEQIMKYLGVVEKNFEALNNIAKKHLSRK